MSLTFRCYVKYEKQYRYRNKKGKSERGTKRRKSKYFWVNAMDRNRAVQFMEEHRLDVREGETYKIVATAWKEDQALREQGAQELPLDLG